MKQGEINSNLSAKVLYPNVASICITRLTESTRQAV